MRVLQELNLPRNGDFYICGPSTFMSDLTSGLKTLGVRQIASTPSCSAPVHPLLQALRLLRPGRRICRQVLPAQVLWFRLPVAGSMCAGGHRSKACSSWPRFATYPCGLRAEPASATPARADLWPGTVGYRPDPVDAPSDGNVLICCAQPSGDVVIDL